MIRQAFYFLGAWKWYRMLVVGGAICAMIISHLSKWVCTFEVINNLRQFWFLYIQIVFKNAKICHYPVLLWPPEPIYKIYFTVTLLWNKNKWMTFREKINCLKTQRWSKQWLSKVTNITDNGLWFNYYRHAEPNTWCYLTKTLNLVICFSKSIQGKQNLMRKTSRCMPDSIVLLS